MQVAIDPTVLELFPEALVGVVSLHGADNSGRGGAPGAEGGSSAVRELFEEAQERRRRAGGPPLDEEPLITGWREAYRRFGADPRKHPSSIESLLRRVLAGNPLRAINPLVDLYNVVSLRHLLPVGGEDRAALRGDVRLTRAGREEPAVALLGDPAPHPPRPGEVIYRDDLGAICRRWNWREAERTRLTPETRDAILVVEALSHGHRSLVESALADLASLAARHCGAAASTHLLDRSRPAVTLPPPPAG